MQIGLAVIAIIGLIFINGSGGLAPEQFSVTKTGNDHQIERVAGTPTNQERVSGKTTTARVSTPVETREIVADYRAPVIKSYSSRNIEDNSALLRTDVNMRDHKGGTVYVVYGYNKNQVETLAKSSQVLEKDFNNKDDRARVMFIDLNPRGEESYEKKISQLVSNTDYYYQVCLQYTDLGSKSVKICDRVESFSTNPEVDLRNRFTAPYISANRAYSITDGESSVEVNLRMNDGVDGIPFIVYGLFEKNVREVDKKYSSYSSVREYDEDLQKKRLGTNRLGRSEYLVELDDLEGDSKYYYRACVEYDGEKDGLVCSGVRSFETDDQNKSNKPTVETNKSEVRSNGATLSGDIRMGDFNDGYAFFVYGINFEKIKDTNNSNSFDRIRQSVDGLQKVAVSDDVDGRKSFKYTVTDLKIGQIYHHQMCVQYVDENDYGREEFKINCGEVRSWISL